MSLTKKISKDMVVAMKAKDQTTLRGLRAIKAALQTASTDGSGKEMDEGREVQILQKLAKQRQDSLDIYVEQNREDLAVKEREELAIIQKYLPKMLSADELKPILAEIIQSVNAEGMKDMGKVMGIASKQLAGKAEGREISTMVRQLLG